MGNGVSIVKFKSKAALEISNGESAAGSTEATETAGQLYTPQAYKEAAWKKMKDEGVHSMFLNDAHWEILWGKHFEGSFHNRAGSKYDDPIPKSFEGSNLRILQWNLLAEGLVPEGFLMPLVSKVHVEQLDQYLTEKLSSGSLDDVAEVAKWSSQGHRSIVQNKDASPPWEDFATMACAMVQSMKGLPTSMKEEKGESLRAIYNDAELAGGEQLTINEKAIVAIEHRLLRVFYFVSVLQPDIICFQELDNFAYVKSELQKLGYACSFEGAPDYVPLKDRAGTDYAEKLASSQWAFAPKWGLKKSMSLSRFFLQKRIKDGVGLKGQFNNESDWPIDDDGQAIFWRADRFHLVRPPEFFVLPGKKDINAFIDGTGEEELQTTHGDGAAVRVLLEFNFPEGRLAGQQFFVHTTHLSSGTDCEVHRIHELRKLGNTWGYSGLPEIWSMDANTEVDFEDCHLEQGSPVPIPMEANAINNFMRDQGLQSIWDGFYENHLRSPEEDPPVSVWKMRGSASAQPKKVGEDMYQLIDHLFYRGRDLFFKGKQALRLREKMGKDASDRDWLALMPNELLPSDHLPIAWDFELNIRSSRREPPVLLSAASRIFEQKLVTKVSSFMPETLTEEFKRLWLIGGEEKFSLVRSALDREAVQKWVESCAQVAEGVMNNDTTTPLEHLREIITKNIGRRKEELFYLSVISALVLAAAATVSSGAPVAMERSSVLLRSGRLQVRCLEMMLGLGALRCITRAIWQVDRYLSADDGVKETLMQQLWSCAAQVTELISDGDRPVEVRVFDAYGKVDHEVLDAFLLEVGKEFQYKAKEAHSSAPALLGLACVDWKHCGTGAHVATATKAILRAIDGANLHLHQGLERNTEILGQTFDEAACVMALKSLASSGYMDSGGALGLLLDFMGRHLDFVLPVEGFDDTKINEHARQARALNRDPPLIVASFVRRAVVSALEKFEPIERLVATSQKLDVRLRRNIDVGLNEKPNITPVNHLVQALRILPQEPKRQHAHISGDILQILCRLCERVGPAAMLPPFVHSHGMVRLEDLLEELAQLEETDVIRWETHRYVYLFLNMLSAPIEENNNMAIALQRRVQNLMQEPNFSSLLARRRERTSQADIVTAGSVQDMDWTMGEINKYSRSMSSSFKVEDDTEVG